jgi:hypothetical protein
MAEKPKPDKFKFSADGNTKGLGNPFGSNIAKAIKIQRAADTGVISESRRRELGKKIRSRGAK